MAQSLIACPDFHLLFAILFFELFGTYNRHCSLTITFSASPRYSIFLPTNLRTESTATLLALTLSSSKHSLCCELDGFSRIKCEGYLDFYGKHFRKICFLQSYCVYVLLSVHFKAGTRSFFTFIICLLITALKNSFHVCF